MRGILGKNGSSREGSREEQLEAEMADTAKKQQEDSIVKGGSGAIKRSE